MPRHLQPESGWLRDVRGHALERFVKQGFPTIAEEDWRYTDLGRVAGLTESPFLVPTPPHTQPAESLRQLFVPGVGNIIAVFMDGDIPGGTFQHFRRPLA